jgi:hypothetical protein
VRDSLSVSTLASVESGIPTRSLSWRKVQEFFFRTKRIRLPNVLFLLAIVKMSLGTMRLLFSGKYRLILILEL